VAALCTIGAFRQGVGATPRTGWLSTGEPDAGSAGLDLAAMRRESKPFRQPTGGFDVHQFSVWELLIDTRTANDAYAPRFCGHLDFSHAAGRCLRLQPWGGPRIQSASPSEPAPQPRVQGHRVDDARGATRPQERSRARAASSGSAARACHFDVIGIAVGIRRCRLGVTSR
jgi:hypothetical protein